MNLLAVETSTPACSVALQINGERIERHEVEARIHSRRLVPMIGEVLAEAGSTLTALDAIVLGNGPGSFIGMRIGASVVQGLARGAELGILTPSSLAAVATLAMTDAGCANVAVAQDAHMQQVYLGVFGQAVDGRPELQAPEVIVGKDHVIPCSGTAVGAGAGWQRYPELLEANRGKIPELSRVLYPRATALLDLLKVDDLEEQIDPARLEPAYLRDKVAEKPTAG